MPITPPSADGTAVSIKNCIDTACSSAPMARRIPPGNQREALKGDRKGLHSIGINDQWRVCFTWHDAGAYRVEILDYH